MQPSLLQQADSYQSLIQLGLINLGLLIILLKQLSFLYSIISFLFIFTLVSLVYHHLIAHGQEPQASPLKLFDNEFAGKFHTMRSDVGGKLKTWLSQEAQQQPDEQIQIKKRTNSTVIVLVAVYFCLVFVYDWMQAFVFVNFCYVYFFMPEVMQKGRRIMSAICNSECPFVQKG